MDVDFDGTGEVLHVESIPKPGRRSLEIDSDTGLISGETYEVMPTSYVIQRYGFHPGLGGDHLRRRAGRALDAEDPRHPEGEARAGDLLRDRQEHAGHPGLVAREVREGHNVGSHPGPTRTSPRCPAAQTTVELSATQRLFETITGRSMRLFRPPFFGDAEPSTPREVAPMLSAQEQGYLCVGLRIDPDDWQKPDAEAHRRHHHRAPAGHGAARARWCCCTIPAATAAAR